MRSGGWERKKTRQGNIYHGILILTTVLSSFVLSFMWVFLSVYVPETIYDNHAETVACDYIVLFPSDLNVSYSNISGSVWFFWSPWETFKAHSKITKTNNMKKTQPTDKTKAKPLFAMMSFFLLILLITYLFCFEALAGLFQETELIEAQSYHAQIVASCHRWPSISNFRYTRERLLFRDNCIRQNKQYR